MESGDTCGSAIGRMKKVEKTRRTWTPREKDVLITALKDVITKGWKSENGFKPGYLTLLESTMNAAIPVILLGKSGVGWSDTDNTVDATDETWDTIIKIFGNDRATGEHSQTFQNALNDVLKLNDDVPNEIQFGDAFACNTTHAEDDSISETHTPSSKPNVSTSSKEHKRKQMNEVDDAIVAAINNLADITKLTMKDLVQQLAAPDNLTDAQDVVLDALHEMHELSEEDQVIAAQLLFNNHNDLALFKRLNDKGKLTLVRRLLRGD
ncbi:hypothetical protein F511_23278 [Dorcoceras hygrometricum]|uniref:Myb/SANT-like domain-containing protein n=1 Tax=Dorcoceras hygrometricum TaxID=472368 RepID=A0A2Z7BNE5_9LAMI|nr:hypothetical protein F511_23278 [Dorcoceras hygrometricum]